jgi:hypothetical protein
MSYYMGDYRGDFYQGDPGLFSLIGRAGRAVGGAIRAFRGAPATKTAMVKVAQQFPAAAGIASQAGAIVRRVGQVVAKHPVLTAAGAAGTIGVLGGGAAEKLSMHMGGAAQKGFHISRRTGRVVRNRHMRVTNPKALRRALRRAHGFAKLAMRTIHLVHPRKKARFGGFKKKRR